MYFYNLLLLRRTGRFYVVTESCDSDSYSISLGAQGSLLLQCSDTEGSIIICHTYPYDPDVVVSREFEFMLYLKYIYVVIHSFSILGFLSYGCWIFTFVSTIYKAAYFPY